MEEGQDWHHRLVLRRASFYRVLGCTLLHEGWWSVAVAAAGGQCYRLFCVLGLDLDVEVELELEVKQKQEQEQELGWQDDSAQ